MSEIEVIVGMDLGTTNSAVGVVESGFPILLADEEGRRLVPSAVWTGAGGTEVGWKARRRMALGGVATSVKRRMGQEAEAEGVSGEILKELKRIAEMRLEREVRKAVITVPAYFNEGQRGATKRAGELAGLEVVRLLSEPTAAALAYGLGRVEESRRVVVYDLGGGTFDVSILEMREGQFEVLATAGDTRLGGDDFDGVLAELVLGAGWREGRDGVECARILEEAERVKRDLGVREEVTFGLPFLSDGAVERVVTREEFERGIEPWLRTTEGCCRRAMADAGLRVEEIEEVVLAGGSTRVRAVKERVERIFGKVGVEGVNPDECVALGAAIQAGIISGAVRDVVLLDVTPLSLGIETLGGLMNVIIPRNTTIPCKAGEMFTNAVGGQRAMRLRVLQGERELAQDNWELGVVEVPFEAEAKGQARVGVQFSLDANGLLEVLARDTKTMSDTILRIESAAVDVADEAVETMIGASVEYAFEDMRARVWTEARLKAEELLGSLGPAMELAGGDLQEEERERIYYAEEAVKGALAEGPEEGACLKAAVEELDRASERLAALVLEKLMGGD